MAKALKITSISLFLLFIDSSSFFNSFIPPNAVIIVLTLASGFLVYQDIADRYCLYEGGGEVVIEYWRDKELSVKLIYANDPARALMRYYDAERLGAVTCMELGD